jgi:hypothetical protein
MEEKSAPAATVDPSYWEKLCRLHPTEVCNRTEARYHPSREGFLLPVYNRRYLVLPKMRTIGRVAWNDQPIEEDVSFFFSLMVLAYLNEAKDLNLTHTWVSEKDLRGGATFFRGPHHLQVEEMEKRYGRDPEGFLQAGKRLGGHEIFYGDKGFALGVFPKIPLAYVWWAGDEEFPPRMGILFDATIQSHFNLDMIWCMVTETTRLLMEAPVS